MSWFIRTRLFFLLILVFCAGCEVSGLQTRTPLEVHPTHGSPWVDHQNGYNIVFDNSVWSVTYQRWLYRATATSPDGKEQYNFHDRTIPFNDTWIAPHSHEMIRLIVEKDFKEVGDYLASIYDDADQPPGPSTPLQLKVTFTKLPGSGCPIKAHAEATGGSNNTGFSYHWLNLGEFTQDTQFGGEYPNNAWPEGVHPLFDSTTIYATENPPKDPAKRYQTRYHIGKDVDIPYCK